MSRLIDVLVLHL